MKSINEKVEEIMRITADYKSDENTFFTLVEKLVPEEKQNSQDYDNLINEYMDKAWFTVYKSKLEYILSDEQYGIKG